jgi:NADPH-dependent F420 reductase
MQSIAVIGGTGAEGSALALRFARARHRVVLGSRDPEKARIAATGINTKLGTEQVFGTSNVDAVKQADIILLTVPYASQKEIAMSLRSDLEGKILIDATVPLVPPKVWTVQLPEGGSAVANLQEVLGGQIKVVAAFQNVSAHHLKDLDHPVECDVLVCGDDAAACATVIELAKSIGLRGIPAGPIANAVAVEALTSILISINRRFKVPGSGIRITGLD